MSGSCAATGDAARHQDLAASYHAMHETYRQREAALAAATADRTAWEEATRQQRQLAVAADAELRRRHPGQPHPPLRSAETQPDTRDQHDESVLNAHDHIEQTKDLIAELTVQRREFARQFSERTRLMLRSADRDDGDLGAPFEAWTGQARDAILQPPKPQIEPSARILDVSQTTTSTWKPPTDRR
jgi:hypothetical protein